MPYKEVMLKAIDEDIWRAFRSYCIMHDFNVSSALNDILEAFLKKQKR